MLHDSLFYHSGVETSDGADTELVNDTGLSPGEGSMETIGSNPTESKKQGVQENAEEDKWDTGDVIKENLISGGDIGKL